MDVEEFIELVKQRPCLYDYKDSLYINKNEKEKMWKEIATTMEITSELAKNKWKNLKDNYTKHLKGTTAISGPYLKYLHWSWAPNMEFMKRHLKMSASTINLQLRSPERDHETENIDSAQSSTRSDNRSEDIPITYKRYIRKRMSRQCEFTPHNNIDSNINSNMHNNMLQYMLNEQDDDYDGTDLIFLGYAKAIKSFSIRKQAEIKFRIAKIITDEEIAHYEDTLLYPESPVYYSHSPSPQNDPLTPKIVQIKHEQI